MLKLVYTAKTCLDNQGGDSKISSLAVNLWPQGTGQVEINNCTIRHNYQLKQTWNKCSRTVRSSW